MDRKKLGALAFGAMLAAAACTPGGGASTEPSASAGGEASPAASGGASPAASAPAPTKGTLKIGASFPLSGNAAADGVPTLKGVQLAVNEINAAGGAGGYLLEVEPHGVGRRRRPGRPGENDDGAEPEMNRQRTCQRACDPRQDSPRLTDRRRQRRLARHGPPHRHRGRGLRGQRPPVHPGGRLPRRLPPPPPGRRQRPRAGRRLHRVARLHRAHALRRTGEDHVAGMQRIERRAPRDQLAHAQDEVARAGVLARLAVDRDRHLQAAGVADLVGRGRRLEGHGAIVRNLAVSQIICATMQDMGMKAPAPTVDLDHIRREYHAAKNSKA